MNEICLFIKYYHKWIIALFYSLQEVGVAICVWPSCKRRPLYTRIRMHRPHDGLLERQTLFLIVPSKIRLLNLSKRNWSNRSCGETEKGRPPCPGLQTQIEGGKECPPSLSSLSHLSRFELSMTVTQFQVSNYPCSLFSTISHPTTNTVLP